MDALFLLAIFLSAGLVGYLATRRLKAAPQPTPEQKPLETAKIQKPTVQKASTPAAPKASHPSCVAELKNKEAVKSIQWDPRNRFFVASSSSNIYLYEVSELEHKDHRVYRIVVQGESPSKIAFSSNGFFVVSYEETRALDAFATFKKKTEEGKYYKHLRKFPGQNNGDLTAIQVTPDCHNIMTCAKDTTILIWDLKGNIVDKLQTKQLAYNMAVVSPHGQYLAIATAMSDIKIHRLNYLSPALKGQKGQQPVETGNSTLTGIEKTHFTRLDGHAGGVTSLQFTSDSKHLLSASRDGTWKLWDLAVDYHGGFVPKVLLTGNVPGQGKDIFYSKIYLSPDNKIFVAPLGKDLHFWSVQSGKLIELYSNSHDGYITEITWSPDSTRIATLATDNLIRLFKIPSL